MTSTINQQSLRAWRGKRWSFASACALAFAANVCSAPSSHAILGTFSTSGVYDEQFTNEASPAGPAFGNFMNAVDLFAAGNNIAIDPVINPTSYTQFQADIQAAFNANKGGVISFDNDTNVTNNESAFVALVGSNQATQLTVTRTDGQLNNNNNHNVISGLNYLGLTTASPCTLSFSLPLETFAITGLGRGTLPTMTLSIIYDDNTEHTFAAQTMGLEVTGDTLFAWKAPAPRTIKGVRFVANNFIRYDDMAVILANFQPGDADGDFDVDVNDFNLIKNNFGLTPATKAQGDVTGDGIVNLADFQLWKANEVLATGGLGAPVPEPGGAVLALMGFAALMRRRHKVRAD